MKSISICCNAGYHKECPYTDHRNGPGCTCSCHKQPKSIKEQPK